MTLKKLSFYLLAIIITIATTISSCKSKISDETIKATVEAAAVQGIDVSVQDGVVTLTGEVSSDAEKAAVEATVRDLKAEKTGIKSVVSNIAVNAPAPEINADDADLAAKVTDAIKDFPGVNADVRDGVITVTGELSQTRVQVLKMALDKLNPRKTDLSGITVK